MHQSILFLLIAALLLITPDPAFAGQLSDFERDATKRRQESGDQVAKSNSGSASSVSDDVASEIGDECIDPIVQALFGGFFAAIAAGGSNSLKRVETDGTATLDGDSRRRKGGEALLPFFRLDSLYQNVEGDVTATDARLEAGYGPLGFQFRRTVYDEKDPRTSMRIMEYYVLYRMSAGSRFEVDLGAGEMALSGMQSNTGFSVTVPVLYHPSEFFGVELRPAWSTINENPIQDMEIAVLAGMRYVSVKAGYRWMTSPHQSLDGPEIGLAIRW